MADLFEFINDMIAKPNEFKSVSPHERGKHFFMVNRLCSIRYPVQAAYFNHLKINPAEAVTFWQSLLASQYNRTPGWMYVKTKKEKEKKKAVQPVEDSVIQKWCEAHQWSRRDFDDAVNLLDEKVWDELIKFKSLLE